MNAVNVFEDWLENYLNFEKNPKKNIFWIDTIDFLCKRFDNPQDNSPCFHVAGSKGKGSVSRMISSILEEAEYSVGVYSSPHIIDFRERISKPSSFFEEFIYEDTVKELVPKIESIIPEDLPGGRPLTWFELVTIYAFLCFRRAKVDWTVYEVGMGGRLDATNIVRPKLCCITPIELEHTEFLGDTIEKIAGEKAGIIKNCTPVIIAKQQTQSVNEVFIKKAEEKHAPIYFVDKLIDDISYKFDKNSHKMNISIESSIFSRTINANLSLLGGMQAQNAAQAAIAVKKIYPNLNENIIEKGLEKAFLPGRFEIVSNPYCFEGIPNLILDGAHTVKSISLTLDTLKAIYGDNKVNLLFACAADKDIIHIASLFKGIFNNVYVTRPGEKKESNLEREIESFKNAKIFIVPCVDYIQSIHTALKESSEKGENLLVTGSFYLVAEVKKYLSSVVK